MNKRAKKQKAIIFVIVLILALIFVYPLFLIVMNSVKPLAQILTKPLSWPDVFQIENYVKAQYEGDYVYGCKQGIGELFLMKLGATVGSSTTI